MDKPECSVCNSTMNYHAKLFDDRYGSPNYYEVFICKKCGFGRTNPALQKDKIGAFYKKYYPLNKTTVGQIKKQVDIKNNFNKWLFGTNNISHLYIQRNSRVLDIGSASGVSLLEIKALGSEAYGVEPDPTAQVFAKKLGLNVYKGFISDNPFPKLKFDFVTASQVIEHEPDPIRFLLSAKKKLKKDGKLILTFPNLNAVYRYIFGRKWIHWHIPYHINHFTYESIYRLTKLTGLKVVKIKTITPNLWTIIQLRCLFVKNEVGIPSPVWNTNSIVQRVGRKDIYFTGLLINVINKIAPAFVLPVNRVVDSLGYGESFLVELKKNE